MIQQWVQKISKLVVITLISSLFSGCVFLMLGGPSKLDSPETPHRQNLPDKIKVYTMRGFLDVFSTGMNSLAKKIHSELNISATALSHVEEKKLADHLIHKYQNNPERARIVLIGHSYGADDQISLAKRLNKANIPVELIITLDNTKKQIIPPNVRTYYNINSGRSVVSWLVPWGESSTASGNKTKIVEINLVKDKYLYGVNHFNIDKLPEVQALIIDIIKDNVLKKR